MRFRRHQEAADRSTHRLLWLFALLVLALVLAVNGVLALLWWLALPFAKSLPQHFVLANTAFVLLYVLGGWAVESSRLSGGGAVGAEALMLAAQADRVPSFREAKRAFEARYVASLLRLCEGNISQAARLAKKDRKDFYDVIRRTGVDPSLFRR